MTKSDGNHPLSRPDNLRAHAISSNEPAVRFTPPRNAAGLRSELLHDAELLRASAGPDVRLPDELDAAALPCA